MQSLSDPEYLNMRAEVLIDVCKDLGVHLRHYDYSELYAFPPERMVDHPELVLQIRRHSVWVIQILAMRGDRLDRRPYH